MTNEVEVDTPENAEVPIDVTVDGIVILVKLVVLKASFPMVINPLDSETDVNPVQEKNAEVPIDVTVDGIVILVIRVLVKAEFAMAINPLVSETDVKAVHS